MLGLTIPVILVQGAFKRFSQIAGTLTAYCKALLTSGFWIAAPPGVTANSGPWWKPTYILLVPWTLATFAVLEASIASTWSGDALVIISTFPAINSAVLVDASGITLQITFSKFVGIGGLAAFFRTIWLPLSHLTNS